MSENIPSITPYEDNSRPKKGPYMKDWPKLLPPMPSITYDDMKILKDQIPLHYIVHSGHSQGRFWTYEDLIDHYSIKDHPHISRWGLDIHAEKGAIYLYPPETKCGETYLTTLLDEAWHSRQMLVYLRKGSLFTGAVYPSPKFLEGKSELLHALTQGTQVV